MAYVRGVSDVRSGSFYRFLSDEMSSTASPVWLKDGELLVSELKAQIGRCAENLSEEEDEARVAEGAGGLYDTMAEIWGLEAGEAARRAADIACDEIR